MALPGETLIEDQKRVISQWAACWSAHDIERLLLLFTADVVYEDVPMGASTHGLAEFRTFAEKVFAEFPNITFELRFSFTDGNQGGAEWVMRGTRRLPDKGRRVDVRGVSVFEFAGDRIRRCSDYWDMATYLEQLGLNPPTPIANR